MMNHHPKSQKQKPAQASSKAMWGEARSERQAELQAQALKNATSGASVANYQAIFDGFAAMGIDPDDVMPRENVFTFNAWKALGRVVKRGQHGVRIVTVIPCTKKDPETGEETPVRKPKTTTVFHVSQTEAIN
ncbi:ssDNA-binding domain-containing protein [Rhizobium sp. TRM95111]|uniref:ArdC-like ssDNA-binding domain-containing protein n=1 Tax=Rhizobium alarense TaxID=2846851 RepID=UPI001EEBD69D|nr:ArdC-like ssDNA-binding domain-containing protein [Rhizobium alarense]MCF3643219.1 ssDNA-binding domain-containing protein [Rhizobium alarense]